MLILGCDIGSETHYVRAIDTRGREPSKSAFPFNNDIRGRGYNKAREIIRYAGESIGLTMVISARTCSRRH